MRISHCITTFLLVVSGLAAAKTQQPLTSTPTANEASEEIANMIQGAINGNVTVDDETCDGLAIEQTSDLITATVDGEKFYIVLSETDVDGRAYNASVCTRYSKNTVQMECAASPVVPDDSLPDDGRLVFYMRYSFSSSSQNSIIECPSVGEIVYQK